MTDRAKALVTPAHCLLLVMTASFCSQVTLCENLREEYLDRMNQNGCSPRLEQLFAKQRKQYEFRNLLQKYGSVLLSPQGELALNANG